MEKKEIYDKFGKYSTGAIFNLSWDRGNGPLSNTVTLLGFENREPLLAFYYPVLECSDEIHILNLNQLGTILSLEEIKDLKSIQSDIVSRVLEAAKKP